MENKDRFGKILLLTLIIILGFVAYKRTESHPSATVSVEQKSKAEALLAKDDVEKIVKDYIMNNPSIIIESIEKMHKKKMDEMNAKTTQLLKSKKSVLENDKNSPVIGSGPVNIVMIYDYACSYCKKASLVVDKLLAENDQVRVIYKPYPILGDSSEYMTKVAMSVYKLYPNKFSEIHNAMIARKISSREDVIKILEDNGLSAVTIEAEFENNDIKNSLANLTELAHSLKIQGVPVFIIDDNLYPGLLDLNRLGSIIEPLMPLKSEEDDEKEVMPVEVPSKASEEKSEDKPQDKQEESKSEAPEAQPAANLESEKKEEAKASSKPKEEVKPEEPTSEEVKKPQIAPIGAAPQEDKKEKPAVANDNNAKPEEVPAPKAETSSTPKAPEPAPKPKAQKLLKEQKPIKAKPSVK